MDKILNSWWSILDDPQLMILYIAAALLYLMYKDGKKEKILMQEKELEKAKLELAKKEKQEKRK